MCNPHLPVGESRVPAYTFYHTHKSQALMLF